MELNIEMLESIVRALDIGVYVSDLETDEILFTNNKSIAGCRLGESAVGEKCWKRFHTDQSGRCPWCKKGELLKKPGAPIEWEQENPISGISFKRIDRVIDWPNGRKVHMQQIMDSTQAKHAWNELVWRENTLDLLNSAAVTLLMRNGPSFKETMSEGVNIIAGIVKFDRMSIFRNAEKPDGLHASQVYRWVKQSGGATDTINIFSDIKFSELLPLWDSVLATGKPINGPVRLMKRAETLRRYGLISVFAVPVEHEGRFWGFVIFEDLKEEKYFTAHEAEILRSASFMLANVVIRGDEAQRIHEAEERVRLLLDTTPLACHLWDRSFNLVECNEFVIKLYGFQDKKEYMDRFYDMLPEYQPDGHKTIDRIFECVAEAFEKGSCSYQGVFSLPDGTPIPSENMLFRVRYGEDYGVVAYSRDLREQRKMMAELEYTSALLEDALVDAREADHAKSSFLAHMSHEIRTPMNVILGITEILVQDEKLPEEVMKRLIRIYTSCELLQGIINDVLDFSKIEAGKMDITPAPYNIASLINDSIHLNMMRLDSKAIEFSLEIDQNIPKKLVGDELRIKQILNNLLSNAFKYTDSGSVTLRVGCAGDTGGGIKLVLEVQDTGYGMTRQQIDKLFDEYTRFQPNAARAVQGTGLGMAITQRLVYLMGGNIHVESEPGRGSLFVVSLPQGVVDQEVLGKELAENLRSFKMSLITHREKAQLVRDPMPYGKVLLVDDMETNIYVAVGLLKLYGLQTDTASSGFEAVEKIKAGNIYDIIFMDHMMPGMDGMETTERLRSLGYNEPIVALTANAVTKQAELFLSSGFDDFIAKPIDIRQLNAVLNKLVRDKQPPETILRARHSRVCSCGLAAPGLDPMLLSSFTRDARKAVNVLEKWSGSEDPERLRQFTITVHGMKSALANIGETELSSIAGALELAGKEGNVARIDETCPGFIARLRALIERNSPGESDGDDTPLLKSKLLDIKELCGRYDRKGTMDILMELSASCSRKTRDALERISEAVLHSNFEEAGEIAANYAVLGARADNL